MIALDTSAVVAIALHEPEEEPYSEQIIQSGGVIGAPTLLECHMILTSRMPTFVDGFMRGFLERKAVHPAHFTIEMYQIAASAFARYGKGRGHPARLNFGDCMAYAVAKSRNVPLLYKGDNFAKTDIRRAEP